MISAQLESTPETLGTDILEVGGPLLSGTKLTVYSWWFLLIDYRFSIMIEYLLTYHLYINGKNQTFCQPN